MHPPARKMSKIAVAAGACVFVLVARTVCAATSGAAGPRVTTSVAPQTPFPQLKADAIERLRAIIDAESKAAQELDAQIRKQIMETREVSLQDGGVNRGAFAAAQRKIERIVDSLEELQRRRDERVARRQAYEQILFQVDSKWAAPPLREFLEREIGEMAITEATDQAPRAKLWKFYSYLSIALREVAEPRENAIDFIVGYVTFSSVLKPRAPSAYVAERSYSNGAQTMSARPMTPEKAGDEADKRLRELGILPQPKAARRLPPGDITVRYRLSKDLTAPETPPAGEEATAEPAAAKPLDPSAQPAPQAANDATSAQADADAATKGSTPVAPAPPPTIVSASGTDAPPPPSVSAGLPVPALVTPAPAPDGSGRAAVAAQSKPPSRPQGPPKDSGTASGATSPPSAAAAGDLTPTSTAPSSAPRSAVGGAGQNSGNSPAGSGE